MLIRTKTNRFLLIHVIGILSLLNYNARAASGITLYTPYTKISVPPGESVDYTIDVINNGSELRNIDISISGMPKDWDYILKSGGWNIKQLSVLPGDKKTLSLKVEVPLKVNKGNYNFNLIAAGYGTLALNVNVSEKGTYKTEFTSDQLSMEGHSKSVFKYNTNLKNQTAEKQIYSIRANTLPGWMVTFKLSNKPVSSIDIEPNSSKNIMIEINPPENIKAGSYKIPVSASTESTSANIELVAVITGSYGMELTTPTGLLSNSITAGDEKRIELLVKNTGSSELKDIYFRSSLPANWEVKFDPERIAKLDAGENTRVFASVKADKKAIPGDYIANLTARTLEVSSNASFRISVKTSMLWGWVGVFIIIIALGSVYYLFRKYGRR